MNPYLLAGLICAAFAALEALLAGPGVKKFMRDLAQPGWSLPMSAWYAVGLLYYGACYATLLPLLRNLRSAETDFWLLILIMASNAGWNLSFFRRRDFRKSFRVTLLYSVFVLVLLWRLFSASSSARWFILAYVAYLPYACLWTFHVWKLNDSKTSAPTEA